MKHRPLSFSCLSLATWISLSTLTCFGIPGCAKGAPGAQDFMPDSSALEGTPVDSVVDPAVPQDGIEPASDASDTQANHLPDTGLDGMQQDGNVLRDALGQPDASTPSDVGGGSGGSGPTDSSVQRDGSGVTSSAGGAGPDAGPSGTCHPLVNEILTGTTASASDEWVEVHNPCNTSINTTGWRLVYRAAKGSVDVAMCDLGAAIAARSYFLCAGTDAASSLSPDARFKSGGLAAAGGGVALRDADGAIVDSVGYGTATSSTNAFVRGAECPAPSTDPPPGTSIGRLPNGFDSRDNEYDFKETGVPTPRAANR